MNGNREEPKESIVTGTLAVGDEVSVGQVTVAYHGYGRLIVRIGKANIILRAVGDGGRLDFICQPADGLHPLLIRAADLAFVASRKLAQPLVTTGQGDFQKHVYPSDLTGNRHSSLVNSCSAKRYAEQSRQSPESNHDAVTDPDAVC